MNNTIKPSCFSLTSMNFKLNEEAMIMASFSIYLSIPLSILATLANGLVLYSISTTVSLQKPSNNLLAFLAVTDLLAGILSLPLNIALRTMELKHMEIPCNLMLLSKVIIHLLISVSVLMIILLSIDRCIAIKNLTKYRSMNVMKAYKIAYMVFWLYPIAIMGLWVLNIVQLEILKRSLSAMLGIVLISVAIPNIMIFYEIHSRNSAVINMVSQQIQLQRKRQLKRSAVTLLTIVGMFFLCYLPRVIHLLLKLNSQSVAFYHSERITALCGFFNSVVNPFLYCYRKDDIRTAVFKLIRNLIITIRCCGRQNVSTN